MSHLRVMAMCKEVSAQLDHGKAIEELIKQDKNQPVSTENQLIYLYALGMRVLDNLSPFLIGDFKREISKFVDRQHPGLRHELRRSKELTEDSKKKLDMAITKYFEVSKGEQVNPN